MRTGMVGGRGIHVDDRAPHRDLAARLDLVLAPVADRDEPLDELVAVELRAGAHDDGLDVLDVRAEPLHERAHRRDDHRGQVLAAGAQSPDDAQAAAHRLGRGRDPLERQRLPRREELDRVVAEVLAQVGGDPLGLDAGRDRDARSGAGRWRGRAWRRTAPGPAREPRPGARDRRSPRATTGSSASRVVSSPSRLITRVNTRERSAPRVSPPIVPFGQFLPDARQELTKRSRRARHSRNVSGRFGRIGRGSFRARAT